MDGADGADRADETDRVGRAGGADGSPPESRGETVRSTGRWRGVVAVVLLAAAVGVLAQQPALLLVAGAAVVLAAYPLVTATPDPKLSVSRRVTPESPGDGERVQVHTTVRNEGSATLPDVRVVDGAPPTLPVVGGSPRRATALPPGGSATVEYELRARPGRHRFRPATLLCRDAAGAVEVETTAVAESPIACADRLPDLPLRARSRRRTGPLVTDEAGSGLEFHSVAEYERGDPAAGIDWRRFARTGELASVRYRTERLADVVVCVDARPEAYRAPSPTEPHAVARAVDAAGRLGDALLDAGHRVGLAAVGPHASLLAPGSGPDHADRLRRQLATAPAFSLIPPEPASPEADGAGVRKPEADGVEEEKPEATPSLDRRLAEIRALAGSNGQVLLLSPLCDDAAPRVARLLGEEGAAVTVISPDPTTGRTAGGRLARLERARRLRALRDAGVATVDWGADAPLGAALSAAGERSR
ncbi:DUF58 domain-containing protein [Halobacteriales archaeon QS_6_71_20]|nr:MAG: DUF58 domain-containing protein [Halobacteriales archaeon QS_6_71_20]